MPIYMISYDLINPHKNYDDVISYIKKSPWCHPMDSLWFVDSAKSDAEEILNDIYALDGIEHNDKILVMEVQSPQWWSHKLQDDVLKWMKNRI